MNQIPLGKLAVSGAARDAIHIAVAPVEAAAVLKPGAHIGINGDGKASEMAVPIGIVDPYLKGDVKPGERFYLCLYPNTITSLRHHWIHSAFKDEAPSAPEPQVDKAASEQWLREYAKKVKSYHAEDGPYFAASGGKDGAYKLLLDDLRSVYLTYEGISMHSRADLIDEADLRYHAQVVLGIKIDFDHFEFSCSC